MINVPVFRVLSEVFLNVFGMNKAYNCTYLQFFHVGLQNDNLDFSSYKISSRNRSIDISHVINVDRYELKRLFLELRSRGKKSICEDNFYECLDGFEVEHCLQMFYRTVNVRIENQGSHQYSYGYDPPSVS